MLDDRSAAALALRVILGIVMLAHSIVLKLLTFGLPGTAGFFESIGLPGWLAYLTFAVEAGGGLLILAGVQVRTTALLLLPFMLGALFAAHIGNGWVFNAPGGGWEYPAVLAALCIVQALLGAGRYALPRKAAGAVA